MYRRTRPHPVGVASPAAIHMTGPTKEPPPMLDGGVTQPTSAPRTTLPGFRERKCEKCGATFVQTRGRPRRWCEACSPSQKTVGKAGTSAAWRALNPEKVEARNAGRRRSPVAQCACGRLFEAKQGRSRCPECSRKRKRASETVRDRRVKAGGTDLTVAEVVAMKARAVLCPLCSVEMTDEKRGPRSKHLDHIVPLAAGGRHVWTNVRVICATCNLRRPSDGSDLG